jgi:hypothetical protein
MFRWHYHQTFPKDKIDALFEPITSKYGIKIVYEIGDDFFSPLESPSNSGRSSSKKQGQTDPPPGVDKVPGYFGEII